MIQSIAFAANDNVADSIREFEIANNYFSDILNSQLIIFSTIVVVLVAINWIYSYKHSQRRIEEEVENKIKDEIKKINKKEKESKLLIARLLGDQANEISVLRADIYRTLGQFWFSRSSYSTAFIWWIRAAYNYSRADAENMVRVALSNARDSIDKIEYTYDLSTDDVGEFQRLFLEINDQRFKVEKELLEDSVKRKLKKKLE